MRAVTFNNITAHVRPRTGLTRAVSYSMLEKGLPYCEDYASQYGLDAQIVQVAFSSFCWLMPRLDVSEDVGFLIIQSAAVEPETIWNAFTAYFNSELTPLFQRAIRAINELDAAESYDPVLSPETDTGALDPEA